MTSPLTTYSYYWHQATQKWQKLRLVEKFLVASWLLILALMPFHALLSTWGGSTIGPLEVWKSWKEILLLVCLAVSVPYLWRRDKLKPFLKDKLTMLIFTYAGLHLLLWVVFRPEFSAAVAGLLMNLRFLGFFLLTGVVLTFVPVRQFWKIALAAILSGAMVVTLFGLMQATFLPDDFLRHFGYSQQTIAPVTTLDDNDEIPRLQSTLRGPNPFGAYLLMLGVLLLALWQKGRKLFLAGWLLAVALLLFSTHSRSAWLGMGVALTVFALLRLRKQQAKRLFLGGLAAGSTLLVVAAVWLVPQSVFLQNTLLHNKTGDSDQGSTVQHLQAGVDSLRRSVHHPFGQGPGSAGPASFYGSNPQIPENYYLQILEEVGVLGVALFVAINALVAAKLWQRRRNIWVASWLAVFAGLTVVSFFLHGWADETIALIWWAGAAILTRWPAS